MRARHQCGQLSVNLTHSDEVNEAIVTMEFHCDAREKEVGIGNIFDDNVLE